MIRSYGFEVLLFALPFLIHALYLVARGRGLKEWEDAPLLVLTTLGVLLMGLGLVLFVQRGEPAGTPYVPAHMDNGRLISPEEP